MPSPHTALQFDHSATDQPQPSLRSQERTLAGTWPGQSPWQSTRRLWLPEPQVAEQADHAAVCQVQPEVAWQGRAAAGFSAKRRQSLSRPEAHCTVRVSCPGPHAALHGDQAETCQPQYASLRHSREAAGRSSAGQSTSAPLGHVTLRSSSPRPQVVLQAPQAEAAHWQVSVERQRLEAGGPLPLWQTPSQVTERLWRPEPQVALQADHCPTHQLHPVML